MDSNEFKSPYQTVALNDVTPPTNPYHTGQNSPQQCNYEINEEVINGNNCQISGENISEDSGENSSEVSGENISEVSSSEVISGNRTEASGENSYPELNDEFNDEVNGDSSNDTSSQNSVVVTISDVRGSSSATGEFVPTSSIYTSSVNSVSSIDSSTIDTSGAIEDGSVGYCDGGNSRIEALQFLPVPDAKARNPCICSDLSTDNALFESRVSVNLTPHHTDTTWTSTSVAAVQDNKPQTSILPSLAR